MMLATAKGNVNTMLITSCIVYIIGADQSMCTSCILCGTQLDHVYHTHFGSYTDELKAFIAKHYGEVPRDTDCICKSHYLEAKRNWSNESYLPKWKEREIHSNKFCSYPKCTMPHDKVMTPAFTNEQTIKGILRLTTDEPIILCKAHYQSLYREVRKQIATPCASCGAKPVRGTMFTRHSPNPKVIQEHMCLTLGVDIPITSSDTICSSCYKLHHHILNQMAKEEHSYDTVLQSHR